MLFNTVDRCFQYHWPHGLLFDHDNNSFVADWSGRIFVHGLAWKHHQGQWGIGGGGNPMVSDEISSLNVQGDVMIPRVRKCTWILPESWDVVEQRVP